MRLEASAPNLRREKRLIATVGGHGTVSAQPGNSKAGGVVRAENVCTIASPEEAMPSVRHGACVRLLDVSHTWGGDDEKLMIAR